MKKSFKYPLFICGALLFVFAFANSAYALTCALPDPDDEEYPYKCTVSGTDTIPANCQRTAPGAIACPTDPTQTPTGQEQASTPPPSVVKSCAPAPGAPGTYTCSPVQPNTEGCGQVSASFMTCNAVPAGYTLSASVNPDAGALPSPPPPSAPATPTSDCPAGQLCYTPLEPLPGLENAQRGGGDFPTLIQGFYRILLNLGLFLAVTVLVLGGITYMFSEQPLKKSKGRDFIKAAIWGLAILGAAWLLLRTINPQLITFETGLLGTSGTSGAGASAGRVPPGQSASVPSWHNSFRIDGLSGSQANVCGTPECDLGLRGEYIIFGSEGAKRQTTMDALEQFKLRCEVAHDDLQKNELRMGTVRQFSGALVGYPGYTGHACVLE